MVLLVLAAILAGTLTTISGFGGGVLLLLAVTAAEGARPALAISALALLVANAHRLWMYRAHIGARVTAPILIGIVPGSFVGAYLATAIPDPVVHAIMLAVVALSLARAWFGWAWKPSRRALTSSAAIVGVLAGGAGGAGFLIGPVILAAGERGRRYLAAVAVSSVAMNTARMIGYGAGGLVTAHVLAVASLLAAALLVGNLIGDRIRDGVPDAWQTRIELGAPVVCVALALGGLS